MPAAVILCESTIPIHARAAGKAFFSLTSTPGLLLILYVATGVLLGLVVYMYIKTKQVRSMQRERSSKRSSGYITEHADEYISSLDTNQIDSYLKEKETHAGNGKPVNKFSVPVIALMLLAGMCAALPALAQEAGPKKAFPFGESGIIITLILIIIPIAGGACIMIVKLLNILRKYRRQQEAEDASDFADYLSQNGAVEEALERRKTALQYKLNNSELAGQTPAEDSKGIIKNIVSHGALPVVAQKKSGLNRPSVDPALARLVLWYIGCAAFWLLFGTTVGEYVGIKFVAPDADHVSWLSFGRLRPVHTNAVFWGWASLGMLGLGHYIVPRVSNTSLASIKKGWYTLILINAAVVLGSLCLMAGINNAGGEYREYIWPVQLLFGIGLVIALTNFLQTVARRTTKEIYISNWYIIAAVIFALVISLVAYWPSWQNGLGETIIQGYYMHQGVGMWFMLFTLGIVYYFLPQQLNKPIYSYSLGILAFWAQILFYTLIGSHHFVFSSIPWWLQTTAIVGSMGMVIPVAAGTTNFIMTFKGAWHKLSSSYTLPFFVTGIIFYFTGSLQGTAEAFRSTNLMWHFTDFTVAHSHLTMYGIISFFLWAAMYAVIPRLTGKEAPQLTIGIHFWLSLLGLMFYTIPLMYGSTMKGLMWMEGKPFIDSVVFMAPYWLWRAIGGSLMWMGHLFFAYNIYKMLSVSVAKIKTSPVEQLNQSYTAAEIKL
ncbi:cytochrome oxidase subunit I [Deminuibacter soli]|uniref:Cytochrome oxidase subunit I n=2 Tax=Deminuibacter soli TaxID=2291815 RepID=A0A3E1NER1_9BACT|nr:cytochrome oxidase subunit I [Deminuibacter soli]